MTASIPALAEISPWLLMLSITLQIIFLATPINAVVSLGEELGWRAYLLPKLIGMALGALYPALTARAAAAWSPPGCSA